MASINTFNKTSWVTMNGLDLLLNGLHVAPYFNTDYNGAYKQKFAVGATITVPKPQRYLNQRNDLTYNAQALSRPSTTVTVDQTDTIAFDFNAVETELDMERGEARVRDIYLKPAMAYIRQAIDDSCAQFAYQNLNMITGSLGTNPTTFDASSAAARQLLAQMGCPVQDVDVGILLPPAVMRALKTGAIGYFNPVSDISKQYRTGIIGEADGMTFYESMSLYEHTAGTWAGAVTVNGANQSGTTLNVTCTDGDTFNQGDKISIANVNAVNLMTRRTFNGGTTQTFTITANVTASGTTAALPIYPPIAGPGSQYQNVDSLPANSAALTLWPGTASPNGALGTVGLALYKDAFMLVGVEMDMPEAVEIADQQQDPDTKIALAFVQQWDNVLRRRTNRFDCLWGFGAGLSEQCAVGVLCK